MSIVSLRTPSTCLAVAISLGLLLLILASSAGKATEPMVAIEDFCSDPRIVVEMQRKDPKLSQWCIASKVVFRRDGEMFEIAVAQVLRGYVLSFDLHLPVFDSIVRLPEDRLVNLGTNSPVPIKNTGILDRHLTRVLDMRVAYLAQIPGKIAPSATYKFDRFYTAFLELTERGYCLSYEMKPPFEGLLSQCGGDIEFSGDVSYVPGATTWRQAQDIACGLIDRGSSRCPVYSMSFVAGGRGQALYVVELLENASRQRLYYAVDAMTGVPSLRGKSSLHGLELPLDKLLEGT